MGSGERRAGGRGAGEAKGPTRSLLSRTRPARREAREGRQASMSTSCTRADPTPREPLARRDEHLERRPVRNGEHLDRHGGRDVLRLARDELPRRSCCCCRSEGRDGDGGEEEGRGPQGDEREGDGDALAVLRGGGKSDASARRKVGGGPGRAEGKAHRGNKVPLGLSTDDPLARVGHHRPREPDLLPLRPRPAQCRLDRQRRGDRLAHFDAREGRVDPDEVEDLRGRTRGAVSRGARERRKKSVR